MYPYHNKIKQRIKNHELVSYEYLKEYNGISPCLLLHFDTEPKTIFEDENIIIVNKPPFMCTHPTGKHLFNCATTYFENIHNKTMHSIHRLDRETSGILLLGKEIKTTARLTQAFEDCAIKKCYLFIAKINSYFQEEKIFSRG